MDHEVDHVGKEVERRAAIVRHRRRDVVREEVVGLMVHDAMVHVVRAGRHAVEVAHDRRRDRIEQRGGEANLLFTEER